MFPTVPAGPFFVAVLPLALVAFRGHMIGNTRLSSLLNVFNYSKYNLFLVNSFSCKSVYQWAKVKVTFATSILSMKLQPNGKNGVMG